MASVKFHFKTLAVLAFLLVGLLATGCTEDRVEDFVPENPDQTPNGVEIVPGILKVNEFSATGTDTANHEGEYQEWMEIYNPTDDTIIIEEGKWFVTDHGWDNPDRFPITQTVEIPPGGFWFIWCDNNDEIVLRQGELSFHTNFSLSRDGEDIGIFYQQENGRLLRVDGYDYGEQREGISEGRKPDGADNWKFFENPTPGESNKK